MLCSVNLIASGATAETTVPEKLTFEDSDNSEIQPLYAYASNAGAGLKITNGTARCTSEIYGIAGTTTKIEITMSLQKKTALWWPDVISWSTTTTNIYPDIVETTTVSSGTYRVKTVFKVYSGSQYETITVYSQEAKY